MNLLSEAIYQTQTTIRAIFDQLPPGIQSRWIRQLESTDTRQPTFKDIVDFVCIESKRVSHPVYKVVSVNPSAQHEPPRPSTSHCSSRTDSRLRFPPRTRNSTYANVSHNVPSEPSHSAATSPSREFDRRQFRSLQANESVHLRPNDSYRPPSSCAPPIISQQNQVSYASRPMNTSSNRLPSSESRPRPVCSPTAVQCIHCQRFGHRITDCPMFALISEQILETLLVNASYVIRV